MKITNTQIEFASSHVAVEKSETKESLGRWAESRHIAVEGSRHTENASSALVQLSDAARHALDAEATQAEQSDPIDNDPRLSVMRAIVEMLTGRKVQLCDVSSKAPPNTPSGNRELTGESARIYERSEYRFEEETTTFSAQGMVRTADGYALDFTLNISMSRRFYEESRISIHTGAAPKDPLVLNFSGTAVELAGTHFQFDLDVDGEMDHIAALKPGNGFLVFDRNQDGKANDGSELFGALTGDGFGELSALDENGNGWIDESDSAYSRLCIWEPGAGEQLKSLKTANVGAISLAHIDTPFSIKDQNNVLRGEIRSTGIFLEETGGVGVIQKIDLVV
ncbi:MAG: hypothetical protein LBK01_04960 [Burkholderiaceae bacterium]|nr:hypothetical protein [Burkholderiaceae bacterium]